MIRAALFDMYETLCSHYRCPLYFGAQTAEDCGVEPALFLSFWRDAAGERGRTLGQITLEERLRDILPRCGITDPHRLAALVELVCQKRIRTKQQCLHALHPGILPMLRGLAAQGIRLGLVSNCYNEEAQVIRAWEHISLFGSVQLSCEAGIAKPDPAIFLRCTNELGVAPEECLYIGDGGSSELETARSLGMTALQAAWYILETPDHPSPLKPGFPRIDDPLHILHQIGLGF